MWVWCRKKKQINLHLVSIVSNLIVTTFILRTFRSANVRKMSYSFIFLKYMFDQALGSQTCSIWGVDILKIQAPPPPPQHTLIWTYEHEPQLYWIKCAEQKTLKCPTIGTSDKNNFWAKCSFNCVHNCDMKRSEAETHLIVNKHTNRITSSQNKSVFIYIYIYIHV